MTMKPMQSQPPQDALPPAAGPGEHARRRMIEEAAYYRAEKRGFAPGRALDDWLDAEREIEELTRAEE